MRKPLVLFGTTQAGGGVGGEDALAAEEFEPGPDGGETAGGGRACVTLLVKPGKIGTKNAGSCLLGAGIVTQTGSEEVHGLADVLAVGLDGVGRGVLFDRQVPQVIGQCLQHQKRAFVFGCSISGSGCAGGSATAC